MSVHELRYQSSIKDPVHESRNTDMITAAGADVG
jgi:hypothetical protein